MTAEGSRSRIGSRELSQSDRESFGRCFDPVAGSRLIEKRIAAREQAHRPEAGRVKRPTQNERILALLTDGKPHSFHEVLRHVPCVVHSRVAELRSRGHDITCERVDGDYRYVLHSSPLSEPDVDAGLLLGRTTAPSGSLSGVTLGDGDGNDAAQLTLIPEQPRRELWAA